MAFVFFWLSSLNMMISGSIHVATNGTILFFFSSKTIDLLIGAQNPLAPTD